MRVFTILLASAVLLGDAACGGDDDDSEPSPRGPRRAGGRPKDLGAIKGYLTEHTARLKGDRGPARGRGVLLRAGREWDFDYAKLLDRHREEVAGLIKARRRASGGQPGLRGDGGRRRRRPVAGRLRRDHRRRRRRVRPRERRAVLDQDPAGKTYKQPGNFDYLIETSLFGTEPKFAAKGVKPDLDGDGKVEFGEALPDATSTSPPRGTSTRGPRSSTPPRRSSSRRAGRAHRARRHDADDVGVLRGVEELALRRRRKATEKAFVAASRLQDIGDILGGLVLDLRQRRAADRRRPTGSRPSRPASR